MLVALFVLIGLIPYAAFVALGWVGIGIYKGGEWLVNWLTTYRHEARLSRLEAELDDKRSELQATMRQLQGELGAGAHDARQALIRASFEASHQDAVNGRTR